MEFLQANFAGNVNFNEVFELAEEFSQTFFPAAMPQNQEIWIPEINPSGSQELDLDNDTLRAQVYKEKGNSEYKKKEFKNALEFYTEGINVNCKDDQLNAILYTNRATSHFSLGNYLEASKDAKCARFFARYSLQTSKRKNTERATDPQPSLYIEAVVIGAQACMELGLYEEAIKWCDDGLAIDQENKTLSEVKCKSVEEEDKKKCGQKPNVKNEIAAKKVFKDRNKGATSGENHCTFSSFIAFIGQSKLFRAFLRVVEYMAILCKEVGDREIKAHANFVLGLHGLVQGKTEESIQSFTQSLNIFRELGNRKWETFASFGLGSLNLDLSRLYRNVRDHEQADEHFIRGMLIFKELEKGLPGEMSWLTSLRNVMYHLVGDFENATRYCNDNLTVCKEVRDSAGEARAYLDLGYAYYCKGIKGKTGTAIFLKQAMSCYKKGLDISQKLGDKAKESDAYFLIGDILQHLGDHKGAKDHYNESFAISKETRDCFRETFSLLRLLTTVIRHDNLQQITELSKQISSLYQEASLPAFLAKYIHCFQGQCLVRSGFLSDAVPFFMSSSPLDLFKLLSMVFSLGDEARIKAREDFRDANKALWSVLLQLRRTEEAWLAAENGRAQTLADLLASRYGFEERQHDHVSQEETASELLACAHSNTVFLAVSLNEINVWLLRDGHHVNFSRQTLDREFFNLDGLFIKKTYEEIGVRCVQCEDRSLDALRNKYDSTDVQKPTDCTFFISEKHLHKARVHGKKESRTTPPVRKDRLSALYGAVVAPVLQHLRGNELVIVPDGPSFLVPFATLQDDKSRYLCESFRIRVIPSLTCLKMIMDAPPDYHCKSGALIVGDPWVQEVVDNRGKPKLTQLPAARKEAKMVAALVKTSPLIDSHATKEEVLKRLNSAALIHLAAHGDIEHGEIALAPNKSRTSKVPREKDFLLTMPEVLTVGLRARLVVLSCCHSGQGEIKDEGVVGIARAFLGAGARSVLVSLWAIDDKATLEFMRVFYQHLVTGKKASEALNGATNHMRQSPPLSEIRLWAPFLLIGDDVSLDCFEGDLDVLDTEL